MAVQRIPLDGRFTRIDGKRYAASSRKATTFLFDRRLTLLFTELTSMRRKLFEPARRTLLVPVKHLELFHSRHSFYKYLANGRSNTGVRNEHVGEDLYAGTCRGDFSHHQA
jgi:hypothetical protein